ncbi:TNT domain-containing protein [Catellatospora tritici]|uniref:TNT domain-containing protein n=1 Tax=Catellatospora tritici TaxID=2851566 RepID=UPI001C2DB777|nr:TNT domain-containing protein [Catellatospora tritici]MBV1855952.1 glycohydrolase toxin TNT-related protein [Catellatospora tritici]
MKIKRFILPVLAGAVLALQAVGAQAAPAEPHILPAQSAAAGDSLCRPGTPDAAPATTDFYDDNYLLGPEQLPTQAPIGPLLGGYHRFGALSSGTFLTQYGNDATPPTRYVYPPAMGYVIQYDGLPIKFTQQLQPGTRIDRFGSPGTGQFLAPLGTPFAQRGLPPSNLNTPTPQIAHEDLVPLANYHVYCVLKPFSVDTGPIATWFAQPSLGTQYVLNRTYLPQAGSDLSVQWLLDKKFLVEERPPTAAYGDCSTTKGASPCPRP